MKSVRLKNMEEYINEKTTVTMTELCSEMNISMNTARMDVQTLVQQGKVDKIYGGVTKRKEASLIPFEDRKLRTLDAKIAIAKEAALTIEDNNIIFIDSGTTTMHMLEYMADKKNITVLTNNLSVVNSSINATNIEIFVLPGRLNKNTNSIVSTETISVLERYNITKCFMATTGVSGDGNVTNSLLLEYDLKRYIMQKAKEKYLLVDHTKYNNAALMTYADIDDFDAVISDGDNKSELAILCKNRNVDYKHAKII